MTLPPNGGAKGSYTSTSGKGPCVRYVVVGSVKIHVPSTGKRSIAHFYRQIVVLPYLNPAVVLAPSLEPIEARVEKGLGWSLGGEKGRVEVRVALGRRSWVSGQRIWCEVAIRNDSTKKVSLMCRLQACLAIADDRSNRSTSRSCRRYRRSRLSLCWRRPTEDSGVHRSEIGMTWEPRMRTRAKPARPAAR